MKRPSLAESMKSVQGDRTPISLIATPPVRESKGEGRGYYAATREGKKKATATLSPEDHRRLKRLSADTGRTIEQLMSEAVNDLFLKHGA